MLQVLVSPGFEARVKYAMALPSPLMAASSLVSFGAHSPG